MKRAIRSNFDASPGSYDEYESRTGRFGALARRLLDEMVVRHRGIDRILDAGAGTGASTRVLAEGVPTVVALDASRPMLAANDARHRVQGDLDRLPFRGGSFDAVAFTASLFLVPDPGVALGEAVRVLAPGGVVGAVAPVGWERPDGSDPFAALSRESRSPRSADEVEAALRSTVQGSAGDRGEDRGPGADRFGGDDTCGGENRGPGGDRGPGEDSGAGTGGWTVAAGEWTFETTPGAVRAFHRTPAGAARLYPNLPPGERVERAGELLADLSGPIRQRWRWLVAASASDRSPG